MVSDEDKALFRDAMQAVKPLNAGASRAQFVRPLRTLARPVMVRHPSRQPSCTLSSYNYETLDPAAVLSYRHPSLSIKQFHALQKGLMPCQGKLDLHGLHTDGAEQALISFLDRAVSQGLRVVLIIHGKGHDAQKSILKSLVNHWLRQLPFVLAFHSALPREGGTGATYLWLSRRA